MIIIVLAFGLFGGMCLVVSMYYGGLLADRMDKRNPKAWRATRYTIGITGMLVSALSIAVFVYTYLYRPAKSVPSWARSDSQIASPSQTP